MSERQVRVTFEPHGRAVFVLPGTTVVEAAGRGGMTVDTPCGGRGKCGKCRVQFTAGASEPNEAEAGIFSAEELEAGWRLSCQSRISAECVIRVPETSLFASQHQILTATTDQAEAEVLPAMRKIYVELPAPSQVDDVPDLLRLEREVGPFKADLAVIRQLPARLRAHGFKGTAVLANHRLIDFEPGDTSDGCYGIAFDIGTTTLVGSLLNLRDGEELAIVSRMNPQVSFGDDVISRIQHAGETPNGLAELRTIIVDAVGDMIDELSNQAGVDRRMIYEVTFAGNTTMEHLLCGLDVAQLGHVPFVPAHGRGLLLPAAEMGLPIHPRGTAYVYPVIGGFVGGDTVAGMLATQLAEQDGARMMIDVGTNGEIVIAGGGEVWAASTAAGPAFEGARISCGMRATGGAIEKIVFGDDVHLSVIGDMAPTGLCGSSMIDLAAALLDAGIVSPEGRMRPPDELPDGLPEAIRRRVQVDGDGQTEFLLAASGAPGHQRRVSVTQRDIRELQLATGAIRAGVKILLKQAGLTPDQIQSVLIAGGFGSFIRRNKAQRIGLLPQEIDHQRIHYVGNASLNGARWALLSSRSRKRAEQYARQTQHVDLSMDLDFQMEFAEAMIFPEQ